jgi:hypothetical protein
MRRRDVRGYEGVYSVDENGNVYSHDRVTERRHKKNDGTIVISEMKIRGKKIRLYKAKNGYYVVNLHKNGQKQVYVHSLVADAFIGKRPSGFTINHIDGNKLNNSVNNLEYCTYKENNYHAKKLGLNKHNLSDYIKKSPVAKLDKDTLEVLDVYDSCSRAEIENGICHVSCAAKGNRLTAGGYKWKYL